MRSRSRASSREAEDRVLDVDPLPRMGTTETPDSPPPSITFHHEERVPTTTAIDEPRSEEDSELADPPKPQRMSFSFMAGIGVSVAVVATACLFLLRSDDLSPGEQRPAAQHFRGIPQMSTPDKSNSTWATVDYAEHGGKVLKLKYDVSHPPGEVIVKLDMEPDVVGITCKGQRGNIQLQVRVKSGHTATIDRMRNATLIAGGRHWGCISDGKAISILDRIVSVTAVTSNSITFKTTNATYADFFLHAKVSFNAAAFPASHIRARTYHETSTRRTTNAPMPQSLQRRGFFSFIGHALAAAWAVIKEVAYIEFKGILEMAAEVYQGLTGKEFRVDADGQHLITKFSWEEKDFHLSKSYDKTKPAGHSAHRRRRRHQRRRGASKENQKGDSGPVSSLQLSEDVRCVACAVNMDVNLIYELHIVKADLKAIKLAVSGNAEMNVDASVHLNGILKSKYERLLAHWHLKTEGPLGLQNGILFSVFGVPVTVELDISTFAGYNFEAQVTGNVAAKASANGHLEYGLQYTDSNGWGLINEFEHGYSGGLQAALNLTAMAQVYLRPAAFMRIEHVGGPLLSFKPFVEASVDAHISTSAAKANPSQTMCPANHVKGAINWGVQGTIQAEIDVGIMDISLYKHIFPAAPFMNIKKPIASGCLALSGIPELSLKPVMVGTTWFGSAKKVGQISKECARGMNYDVTAQLQSFIPNGGLNTGYLVVANNYRRPGSHSCIVQTLPLVVWDSKDLRMTIMSNSNADAKKIAYQNCTNGDSNIKTFTYVGEFQSEDLKTIRLNSTDGCMKLELHRPTAPTHLSYNNASHHEWHSSQTAHSWTKGRLKVGPTCTQHDMPRSDVVMQFDKAFSVTPTYHHGELSVFTASPPLPSWLSLDPSTGTISGTLTRNTAEHLDFCGYVIQAKNSAGANSVRLYINRPPEDLQYEAVNLTRDGHGVEYTPHSLTTAEWCGLYEKRGYCTTEKRWIMQRYCPSTSCDTVSAVMNNSATGSDTVSAVTNNSATGSDTVSAVTNNSGWDSGVFTVFQGQSVFMPAGDAGNIRSCSVEFSTLFLNEQHWYGRNVIRAWGDQFIRGEWGEEKGLFLDNNCTIYGHIPFDASDSAGVEWHIPWTATILATNELGSSRTVLHFNIKGCQPGTYFSATNRRCLACPEGTYQTEEGQTSCKSCVGTVLGSGAHAQCQKCPAGTHGTGPGQCTPCPPGSYSSGPGWRFCHYCSEGKNTGNSTGATRCQPCLSGEGGGLGIPCHPCPVGHYSRRSPNGGQDCYPCQPTSFDWAHRQTSSGQTSCTPTPDPCLQYTNCSACIGSDFLLYCGWQPLLGKCLSGTYENAIRPYQGQVSNKETWQWSQCDGCNVYKGKDDCLDGITNAPVWTSKFCGWCGKLGLCSRGSAGGPSYQCHSSAGTGMGWTWSSRCRSNEPIRGSLDWWWSCSDYDNTYSVTITRRRAQCACSTGYSPDYSLRRRNNGLCKKCW